MQARLRLTRPEILAFRRRVGALDERMPFGTASLERAAWAGLLKVNPNFSVEQRARVLPYKNPGDFQRIVDGLAKAGLP